MIFSVEEEDQPLIDYYDVYYHYDGSPPQAQNLAVDIKRMFGNKDIAKFSRFPRWYNTQVANQGEVIVFTTFFEIFVQKIDFWATTWS